MFTNFWALGELPEMSEEAKAGAEPTAASADGAITGSTMSDAPPPVGTAEAEAVDAEPPAPGNIFYWRGCVSDFRYWSERNPSNNNFLYQVGWH